MNGKKDWDFPLVVIEEFYLGKFNIDESETRLRKMAIHIIINVDVVNHC